MNNRRKDDLCNLNAEYNYGFYKKVKFLGEKTIGGKLHVEFQVSKLETKQVYKALWLKHARRLEH